MAQQRHIFSSVEDCEGLKRGTTNQSSGGQQHFLFLFVFERQKESVEKFNDFHLMKVLVSVVSPAPPAQCAPCSPAPPTQCALVAPPPAQCALL